MEASEKDWIRAEFKVLDAKIDALKDATELLATDRAEKDRELNDVRHRFVPKEEFISFSRRITAGIIAVGLLILADLIRRI